MPADTAVVPPGHKVTVINPTANGHVNVVSSGALIMDYGRNGNWRLTNAQFEAALARRSASAVVILQDEMIVALKQSNDLGDFFAYWTAARAKGISAVWVLPLRASEQTSIISSIHSAGYGVHASAPDGACFVEVHKPDGSVVVGMPGASLQPK
ncbi:hypothetical protein HZ993_00750 [Rhodoferax sp. AJA081-3]|uniref:hypothetical protein n=1 Tax=Rhodoferax sp. AJA081-3 TaxID=2752316 RepID=UPI001AE03AE5|nr:hypothetical protein [Rhodoferax sp. AJA081-3]QTN28422.1 hypothetical protein HZ993_00750 [Rhodoferax sp. AJA081-3]